MKFQKYYGVPKDAKYGDEFMGRFPILFQDRKKSMQETCMCWGIECPIGWYHILEQLCTYLEFHNQQFSREYGIAVVADQVKEKFGTLRFYFSIAFVDKETGLKVGPEGLDEDDVNINETAALYVARDYLDMLADEAIGEAEKMTEDTCADCGVPLTKDNKVETEGWITFLCDECNAKREEKYADRLNQQENVEQKS